MSTVIQFPTQQRQHATAAESSKIMKQALHTKFPATKFTVRLSRGTGYGDCSVSWTDGPSDRLVSAVVAPFEGQTFDGMTDMRESTRATLPDGRESGLRLILTSRHVSIDLARKAATQVAKFYGLPMPEVKPASPGSPYWTVSPDNTWPRADIHEYWSTLIHRAACDRSTFAMEGR